MPHRGPDRGQFRPGQVQRPVAMCWIVNGMPSDLELTLISIRTHTKLRKDTGMIANIFMCADNILNYYLLK